MKHTDKFISDDDLASRICEELELDLPRIENQLARQFDAMRERALRQEAVARSTDEETLVQIARESLGGSEQLDPNIEQRLDQIRLQALKRLPAREEREAGEARERPTTLTNYLRQLVQGYWKLPAGVMASAFALVTTLSLVENVSTPASLGDEPELALIASAEEIELYENLEFYLWLFDSEFSAQ